MHATSVREECHCKCFSEPCARITLGGSDCVLACKHYIGFVQALLLKMVAMAADKHGTAGSRAQARLAISGSTTA